jgi:hypothetical protein
VDDASNIECKCKNIAIRGKKPKNENFYMELK